MLYDEVICDFGNLYRAYRLAHRGKSEDPEVIAFDMDKSNRLHGLLRKLREKRWDDVFSYYRFTIRRPKVREMRHLDENEKKERLISLRSFLSFGNVNRRMLRWTGTIMDAKLNDTIMRRENDYAR